MVDVTKAKSSILYSDLSAGFSENRLRLDRFEDPACPISAHTLSVSYKL